MAKDLKEQIEIMTHHLNGGEVEYVETGFDDWEVASHPTWNWYDFEYRILPSKPKVTIKKWLVEENDIKFVVETSDVDFLLKSFPTAKKLKLIKSYEVEI